MLVKFCNAVGLVVPKKVAAGEQLVVPFDPKEFRYIRFRAIGNMEIDGENGNGDGFPYQWFEDERAGYGYTSFRGKRAHVEHNSDLGYEGSIGDLPDAYLNRFIYPTDLTNHKFADLNAAQRVNVLNYPGQRDGSIEVLMRIDMEMVKRAVKDPRRAGNVNNIIRAIDTGQSIGCSMGTDVQYSHCSVCGNEARFANEYCNDLKFRKNGTASIGANQIRDLLDKDRMRVEWLRHLCIRDTDYQEILGGIDNRNVLVRIAEINHELSFFELSVVGRPAYTKGYDLEKIARLEGVKAQQIGVFTLWVM